MYPSQSEATWTQQVSLPDNILEELETEEVSWKDVVNLAVPKTEKFSASSGWVKALSYLRLPADNPHLGLSEGELSHPLNTSNCKTLVESSKVGMLLLQISEVLGERTFKAKDLTGEVLCAVHPSVLQKYTLEESQVILLYEVVVLPKFLLNITLKNIVKIFH